MKKVLVRFEQESTDYLLVINEIDKYLGKIHYDLSFVITTSDNPVEEDGYVFYWCHKDLLNEYLEK